MEPLLLAGCFFFVLIAVLGGGYWFLKEPPPLEPEPKPSLNVYTDQEDGPIRQTLEKIGSILPPSKDLDHPVRRRLMTAGYREPDALQAFFGIKAVFGLVSALGLMVVNLQLDASFSVAMLCAVCGAGIGYLLPERLLTMLENRRRQKLRQGLPAALDLLVLGLEAGQSLDSAMLEDVLLRLAQRTGEPEFRKLTNLLLDGDRFGTSLGPALRNHAEYTRLRRKQQAQEAARKTSVKLVFPVFFLIFPCVLLVTLGPAVLRLMQGIGQMLRGQP